MSILLFVPFYNCEKQIVRVLRQILPHQDHFSAILCVDNRSTDKSLEVAIKEARELGLKRTMIVRNQENVSLGGSHKVAFSFAAENNFSHIVVFHGDDQGRLEEIIPLIQRGEHDRTDCLLGARFHPGSRLEGYSRFRTIGNIIVNLCCSLSVRAKVLDMGSGLNMYRSSFFSDQRISNFPNDLTFNVYLLFHGYFTNSSIRYFPISWREEDQVSNAKVFTQFRIIMSLILKTLVSPSSLYTQKLKQEYKYDICYQS